MNRSHRRIAALLMLLSVFSLNTLSQTAEKAKADNEFISGGVLWQQVSGERRALSYQAFRLARLMLDQDLRLNRHARKRPAVIVDLDETILDNSPYEARLLRDRVNYPDGWTEWINRSEAAATPGSVEFLRYAAARGVTVFYITNRNPEQKEGTARNLRELGFPNVNDKTLLVQTDPKDTSKETRRLNVGNRYRVVLLMGDSLNDFAKVFEDSKTVENRIAAADRFKAEFGKRFIVLPNPMYGDWELSIYGYQRLSDAEKAELRSKVLRAY